VRVPRDISPRAAARRSWLADALGAAALTVGALIFCAGLGIVGAISLLTLLLIGPWYATEAFIKLIQRRRQKRTPSAQRRCAALRSHR
jgi:hypothetical protein